MGGGLRDAHAQDSSGSGFKSLSKCHAEITDLMGVPCAGDFSSEKLDQPEPGGPNRPGCDLIQCADGKSYPLIGLSVGGAKPTLCTLLDGQINPYSLARMAPPNGDVNKWFKAGFQGTYGLDRMAPPASCEAGFPKDQMGNPYLPLRFKKPGASNGQSAVFDSSVKPESDWSWFYQDERNAHRVKSARVARFSTSEEDTFSARAARNKLDVQPQQEQVCNLEFKESLNRMAVDGLERLRDGATLDALNRSLRRTLAELDGAIAVMSKGIRDTEQDWKNMYARVRERAKQAGDMRAVGILDRMYGRQKVSRYEIADLRPYTDQSGFTLLGLLIAASQAKIVMDYRGKIPQLQGLRSRIHAYYPPPLTNEDIKRIEGVRSVLGRALNSDLLPGAWQPLRGLRAATRNALHKASHVKFANRYQSRKQQIERATQSCRLVYGEAWEKSSVAKYLAEARKQAQLPGGPSPSRTGSGSGH